MKQDRNNFSALWIFCIVTFMVLLTARCVGAERMVRLDRPACVNGICPIPQQKELRRQPAHFAVGKLFAGQKWIGSCVLAGRENGRELIYAAAHQVAGERDFRVSFVDTARVWHTKPAQLLDVYDDYDLAMLEAEATERSGYANPIAILSAGPRRGERGEVWGYGGQDGGTRLGLSVKRGQFTSVEDSTLWLTARAIGGDSGGAIVVGNKLCGILSGGNAVQAVGCGPGPLRSRFADWIAKRKQESQENIRPPPYDAGGGVMIQDGELEEEHPAIVDDAKEWAREKVKETAENDGGSTLGNLAKKALTIGELAAILFGGGGTVAIAWGILKWYGKRKIAKRVRDRIDTKVDDIKDNDCPEPKPELPPQIIPGRNRNDKYAEQLNDLYQYSGNRSTEQDATLGREYDRRMKELMRNTSNPQLKEVLEQMHDDAHLEFERIHSDRPAPVPVTH